MRVDAFDFALPPERIALHPASPRESARMLVIGADGGLTDAERATLDSADNVALVTVPGSVFLLPDEAPDQVAAVIATAIAALD